MSSEGKPYLRGLGLAMSTFQPINKPKSMPKPITASESPDPSDVSPTSEASLLALEACVNGLRERFSSVSPAKPCSKNREFPMVVVPAKRLQGSAASEFSESLQKPNKKRKAMEGTPKALREQRVRAVKLMPTIEHSATSSSTDATPMKSSQAESDSEWSLASTHLGELDSDMSPPMSHRRSPRHRLSQRALSGRGSTQERTKPSPCTSRNKLPRHEVSGGSAKREGTASLDLSVIRPRSPSPSSYNKESREKKLQEEDVVEIPSVELAHERYLRTKEKTDAMERLWREEKRKQKGKKPEYRLGEKEVTPCRETNKALKRQKKSLKKAVEEIHASWRSAHSHLDPRGDQSGEIVPSGKQPVTVDEGPQQKAVMSQAANEILSAKFEGAAAKGSENLNTEPRVSMETMPPLRNIAARRVATGPKAWQAKQMQGPQSGQHAYDRREVEVAAPRPDRCKCKDLPAYFKQAKLCEPHVPDSGLENAEFLAHVRQVSDCRGHNQSLIDTCRFISVQVQKDQWRKAENSFAPKDKENNISISDAVGCAGDWLSSSRFAKPSSDNHAIYSRTRPRREGLSSEQSVRIRQQSSIEPNNFYRKQSEYRVPLTLESTPAVTDKALIAERSETENRLMTPPESSPVNEGSRKRRVSRSALVPVEVHVEDDWRPMSEVDDPTYLTPKSSSPSQNGRSSNSSNDQDVVSPSQSKRSIMDVGTKSRPQSFGEDHALPIGPENKVNQRRPPEVFESPQNCPQPPRSINSQRRRHQSVPATLVSRTDTANEAEASPQAAQNGCDHVLRELSNNAVLLGIGSVNKELASIKKMVLESLQATAGTQSAPIPSVNDPTAVAVTVDVDERPQTRREKWKLEHPRLDRDVHRDLRLPDEAVIEIGKNPNGYERHVQAPYAFSRRGRLYTGRGCYKHLLAQTDENGSMVWNAEEQFRLRG